MSNAELSAVGFKHINVCVHIYMTKRVAKHDIQIAITKQVMKLIFPYKR
jgi:hypothetical protein